MDGSQADYRQNPVRLALVAGAARLACDDPLPGFLATFSVELFCGYPELTAGHLDPDLIGMRRDVVVPAGVARRPGERCDNQPVAFPVGEAGEWRQPFLSRLGADRRQVQQIHAQEPVAAEPVKFDLWVPKTWVRLRDLPILVDQPAEKLTSVNGACTVGTAVGRAGGRWCKDRCGRCRL
jgi:hypothetical protein